LSSLDFLIDVFDVLLEDFVMDTLLLSHIPIAVDNALPSIGYTHIHLTTY
jgi:hypothetical protein